jgi:hypothetical protein
MPTCVVPAANFNGFADQSDSFATPESFASIADEARRSAALFTELGKVLTHPRCVNCHPAGDRPRQGEEGRPHQPPVARGAERSWPAGHALFQLPPAGQLRPCAHAGTSGMASRAA